MCEESKGGLICLKPPKSTGSHRTLAAQMVPENQDNLRRKKTCHLHRAESKKFNKNSLKSGKSHLFVFSDLPDSTRNRFLGLHPNDDECILYLRWIET
jgi:hypothetical protein